MDNEKKIEVLNLMTKGEFKDAFIKIADSIEYDSLEYKYNTYTKITSKRPMPIIDKFIMEEIESQTEALWVDLDDNSEQKKDAKDLIDNYKRKYKLVEKILNEDFIFENFSEVTKYKILEELKL